MSRHRGSTTPMDFEYQNGHGPVDNRSPFMSSAAAKKRELAPFATNVVDEQHRARMALTNANAGPHSVLDSPTKGVLDGFSTPNRPHLREPNNSQHYLFSQNRPLAAVPSHVQNAWEPRTPQSEFDFSSGGETPQTPAQDSDVATPDTQMASKMGRLMSGDAPTPRSKSPKKSRRESFFGLFRSSPSPAKERRYYSNKAEHKVMKRRTKKRELLRSDDYDSDLSRPQSQQGNSSQQSQAPTGWWHRLGLFGSWLEAHPHLPSVLSFWFQLLVNSILGLSFLYILYTLYSGVMADVTLEAQKKKTSIMEEIAICAKDYRDNRCEERPIPAMVATCLNWESCMNRDPRKVALASVSARTFAKIFNSFVEEFSYKSMLFTTIIIFGGFNLSNWAFGVIRGAQHNNSHHQQQQQQDFWPPPPATPQRQLSGGYVDQSIYNTPFRTPYGLQHANQSFPALPAAGMGEEHELRSGAPSPEKETIRSPKKRGLFA